MTGNKRQPPQYAMQEMPPLSTLPTHACRMQLALERSTPGHYFQQHEQMRTRPVRVKQRKKKRHRHVATTPAQPATTNVDVVIVPGGTFLHNCAMPQVFPQTGNPRRQPHVVICLGKNSRNCGSASSSKEPRHICLFIVSLGAGTSPISPWYSQMLPVVGLVFREASSEPQKKVRESGSLNIICG